MVTLSTKPSTGTKSREESDKFTRHTYRAFYESLDKNFKKIAEIGVLHGASLLFWRDFFPFAQIFGFDLVIPKIENDERITLIQGDQSKRDDLLHLLEISGTDIDLFIDDGSHKPEHQVF